jgi:phosphoglucomutase
MLSFAVRKLYAIAGIMITASHNPKEYNGYKVYGDDGAQMSPEATDEVVKYITEIKDYFSVVDEDIVHNKSIINQYVNIIGKSIDKSFYKELKKLTLSKTAVKKTGKSIKLVYTPLHGSGYIPVTTILKKLGIKVNLVEEQIVKDINFSTVKVPNPEYKETLKMGIDLADKIKADVVLGTDPDCDRLGVAIRDNNGEFIALSGNQTGILLLDYILTRLKEENKLPENGFVVKSFVSTGMAKSIAEDFGVELFETPVGFKFIGEKIKLYEKDNSKQFIFGFEESCGYLRGTHCRDKDAVVASMLFAEMVCYYSYKKFSVYDRLLNIYDKYGYVLDKNVSIAYSGLNAMKEMNAVVDALKLQKIEKLDIFNIVATRDYSKGIRYLSDGTEEILDIPKTNCIYYEIENGSFICLRPSGTEPKLKIYYSIKANDVHTAERSFEKLEKAFINLIKK